MSCEDKLILEGDNFILCERPLPHYAHKGLLSNTEEVEWYRKTDAKIHLTYTRVFQVTEPVPIDADNVGYTDEF